MNHPYSEDYFLRGKQSGLSNYENYSWKRDLTTFCAQRMAIFMGVRFTEEIFDFGCARGYYVKAFQLMGYESSGYDISQWAIEHCDPDVKGAVSNKLPVEKKHWILCKDVLEHIEEPNLTGVLTWFIRMAIKGILIIVPLRDESILSHRVFAAPQDNEDKTHVNCWSLKEWLNFIQDIINKHDARWVASASYKLPGVKEACDPYPNSVAFISIRRL